MSTGSGRFRLNDEQRRRIGSRIARLREERRWSQVELAERLEVSRQTIHALETGKYDPSLPLAFKIARLFDRAIEDIFDDEAARSERRTARR